ncbi:MAG: FecR domain-containing protein, partial [Dysgonamonadaceae bacterium]|nr:FecR domain-containing protein [Dysgonamonadaceae bacterium]
MLKIIKNNYDKWELLCRVLCGEMPENDPEFLAWLEKDEENKALFLSLKNDNSVFDTDKIYRNIVAKTGIQEKEKHQRRFRIPVWTRYASIIAILVTSSLFYISKYQNQKTSIAQIESQRIVPGGKKAVLLLANGSSVSLDSDFKIEEKDGISINNDTTGGRLNYDSGNGKTKKVEYHTIFIPIGGEYELKLSDGTQVHLNSGSKLTYPSYFEGNERHVKLEGEAFFDVEHNGKSFSVETENIELKVLGTSFNLSSYGEDTEVATTLVTGSVEVKIRYNNESYLITPGHQLTFNKESKKVLQEKVNTEIYTAWVRGEFIFRNQPMDDILKKLSRWYDFSIHYDNPETKNMRFTGSAEKKRPLSYLLKQIET